MSEDAQALLMLAGIAALAGLWFPASGYVKRDITSGDWWMAIGGMVVAFVLVLYALELA